MLPESPAQFVRDLTTVLTAGVPGTTVESMGALAPDFVAVMPNGERFHVFVTRVTQ